MTNADRIRAMTDDELLEEIYKLQETAVACPPCFQNHGRERLKFYLKSKLGEVKNERTSEDACPL